MIKHVIRLLMVLWLLLLPACCLAATQLPVYVTPASVESFDALESVRLWQTNDKTIYMFLPSTWDQSALKIWVTEEKEVSLNGRRITSGETVSDFGSTETVTLKIGKNSGKVKIMQGSSIPVVYITTDSGNTTKIHKSKKNSDTGRIRITDETGSIICDQTLTQIKCRGNSSFTLPEKKSYQLKLESKQNLFGMGKDKTWLLVSAFRDRSMIRNLLATDLAQYAGLAYTPTFVSADVYINGEYRGLYLFGEKLQIGSNRVEIDDLEEATEAVNDQPLSSYDRKGKLYKADPGTGKWYDIPNDPEDITGGYILRIESSLHYREQPSAYLTKRRIQVQMISPDNISRKQYEYITSLVQSFENAIAASDGIDPDTGKHYSEIGDVTSFVLKYCLDEVTVSRDANHNSQYLYKPADSQSTLLYAGPAWDYDTCLGSFEALKTNRLYVANGPKSQWYPTLYRHKEFQEEVKAAWSSIFLPAMKVWLGEETDPTGVLHSVDSYVNQINDSAQMDFVRWPSLTKLCDKRCGSTFEANIKYLKKFITDRMNWLITEWGE